MRIAILRVGPVDADALNCIKSELGLVYPDTECLVLDEVLPIPHYAYNKERRQFHSSRILAEINGYVTRVQADRVLGVTEVDLYVPRLNFVFGEAMCPGKVAVISLFRLKPEFYGYPANSELFMDRCVKEAVHEIGHTLGLGHCQSSACVMYFSNSVLDTDRKKKTFCEKCYSKVKRLLGAKLHESRI